MSWGLRTRQSGRIQFDSSRIEVRVLGSTTVSASGTVSVPGFADGEAWAEAVPFNSLNSGRLPTVSIAGTTLSWSYGSDANRHTCLLIYGVR